MHLDFHLISRDMNKHSQWYSVSYKQKILPPESVAAALCKRVISQDPANKSSPVVRDIYYLR